MPSRRACRKLEKGRLPWRPVQTRPASRPISEEVFKKKDFFKAFIFLKYVHNDNAYQVMTTALQCMNSLKPCTLEGFEPDIFYSVGGRALFYARSGTVV
jgi:hypothetical protein